MKSHKEADGMDQPGYTDRMKWFHEARFGMFIHYGLYSALERGEWVMLEERIPAAEYAKLITRWNPKNFNAHKIAALACDAGMKYVVLTSRHHEGFCLFDSKVSEFNSAKSCGRDLVAEFVTAGRQAGLKVGFYYSLLDWRFPGYFEPEKYPDSARALVAQAHAQVRELMTNYGKIDVLWYDGGWAPHWKTPMDKMAEFWRAAELNAEVRRLQPHILINNRSGLQEDLDTPEQRVEASESGRGWESCMTIGDSCGWGYIRNNPNMKAVPQLLQNLVSAAAGAGNYLLNIGPKPDGIIRREEEVRLRAVGKWLRTNGKAIYGSERCELRTTMLGLWTRKGNTGYLNIFRWPGQEAVTSLVATKALSARLLGSPATLTVRQEHNGRLIIGGLPARPPHAYVNVIEVKFADVPRLIAESDRAAWLDGRAGTA
jgi:alpha-L-fucosidase